MRGKDKHSNNLYHDFDNEFHDSLNYAPYMGTETIQTVTTTTKNDLMTCFTYARHL